MADVKITKKDYLVAIRGMVEGVDMVGDIASDKVLEFIDTQVAQLDAKAAKAKERAAEKKAEGDKLRAVVKAVLTNELQTRDEIFNQIDEIDGGEDLTVAKVGARLTQLVTSGEAVKEQVKAGDRKVMAYRINSEN